MCTFPRDTCTNKLSPKSELMIYLGPAEGIKGHFFIHSSSNIIFTAAQVLFDEMLFPKCKTACIPQITQLREPSKEPQPPVQPSHLLSDPFDPDQDLPFSSWFQTPSPRPPIGGNAPTQRRPLVSSQ